MFSASEVPNTNADEKEKYIWCRRVRLTQQSLHSSCLDTKENFTFLLCIHTGVNVLSFFVSSFTHKRCDHIFLQMLWKESVFVHVLIKLTIVMLSSIFCSTWPSVVFLLLFWILSSFHSHHPRDGNTKIHTKVSPRNLLEAVTASPPTPIFSFYGEHLGCETGNLVTFLWVLQANTGPSRAWVGQYYLYAEGSTPQLPNYRAV